MKQRTSLRLTANLKHFLAHNPWSNVALFALPVMVVSVPSEPSYPVLLLAICGLLMLARSPATRSLPASASWLYLQNAFNLSDEAVVARWPESPYWQYFSGLAYFEPRPPCDGSLLVKFRKQHLQTVVVDTTVQPKAVVHPTDSRLLEVARSKLVDAAKNSGIALKQTFVREGAQLLRKARGYAHARQFKRLRKTVNRQRTVLGRLLREVQRKQPEMAAGEQTPLQQAVQKASQLHTQTAQRANRSGKGKLYAWHAPEVECISKGKTRTPYEFGVKAGTCTTLKGNLIVGARSFPGNPYDGHTLHEQLEQATIVMQETGGKPMTAVVDLGCRGVDALNEGVQIIHRGKIKSLTPRLSAQAAPAPSEH